MSSTDQAPANNQLVPAQNPQTSAGVALTSDTASTLQTPTSNDINTTQGLSITGVGDSTSKPITPTSTTTTTAKTTPVKSVNYHYPVIFAVLIVVAICAVACVMMMRSSKQSYRKR